jgi:hypothetical protein
VDIGGTTRDAAPRLPLRPPPGVCYIAAAMTKLVETQEWAKLVEGQARGDRVDIWSVFGLLRKGPDKSEDITDLAALLTGEAGAARDVALKILFALCMDNDPDVRPANFRQLCPALKEYVVNGYPGKALAGSAWTFWRKIDPEAAGEYLREWVKRNGIPEGYEARIAIDLTFGNEESMAIVRSFAETHPNVPLGKGVEHALERTAADWPAKLAKLGREWREKREYATLVYLTTQLIDRQPFEKIAVSRIVDVLSEPDSLVGNCYTYVSKDEERQTGFLFLEVDREGKVTGWKLDNIS